MRANAIGAVLGPVLALTCALAPIEGLSQPAQWTLALVVLMAVWWISEAIPLAATALLPIIALPLIGIPVDDTGRLLDVGDLGVHYANPIVLLYVGGFALGVALERWGLSTRIAYGVVSLGGANPRMMLAGFLCAAAFMSMWISNTSTSLILTPLALSLASGASLDGKPDAKFAAALVLGVAYAATIGGLATPIGTPTNGIALQQLRAQGLDISFAAWTSVGVPVMLALLPIAWSILSRGVNIPRAHALAAQARVRDALRDLGPVTQAEWRIGLVFVCVALMWACSGPLAAFLSAHLLPEGAALRSSYLDTMIATLGAVALFLAPAGGGERRPLLTWPEAERIPWGVLLLFGGGLALAAGAELSGLSAWMAGGLRALTDAPPVLVIACVCLTMIVITEFASNIATISLMGPVLLSFAGASDAVSPAAFIVPAAMAASMGFAMPVGSASNAIAYATGAAPLGAMIRRGLMMNACGLAIAVIVGVYWAPLIFAHH